MTKDEVILDEKRAEEERNDLDLCFNGVYNEVYYSKKRAQGMILTIIDAVITDEKQNKNVKSLITQAIWEDEVKLQDIISKWFKWVNDNNELEKKKDESGKPMIYQGNALIGNFRNF